MSLSPNFMLAKRYRISKLLARGGMGAVYRAFDRNLEMTVAIKENRGGEASQFKREAKILSKLRHTGLPRVLDYFSAHGKQYLVMDFIEGLDLGTIIKQKGAFLSQTQALEYIFQVCDTLSYLHSQSPPVIHRDIKPSNIKITSRNRAELVDFGIAKQALFSEQTILGAQGVTPGFSPLEQYRGSGTTLVSDIYALAATLYTLLTGRILPDAITLWKNQQKIVPVHQINASVSPQIGQAINWALALEPHNRPPSVELWKAKLMVCLENRPTVSLPRGGNLSLTKLEPTLKEVLVGLGWQSRPSNQAHLELDSSVFMVKADGKVRSDSDFIFYNNLRSLDGSVRHSGDNPTGTGSRDKQTVRVELAKVPAEISKLIFAVSIYEAERRRQNFGMVQSAFIRVINNQNDWEMGRYDLSQGSTLCTAMIFGELYRWRNEWKFRAVGQGFKDGLGPLAKWFGVDV
jgi:tellurium resistance protein TerD